MIDPNTLPEYGVDARANPGDVCNRAGCIRTNNESIMFPEAVLRGEVWVTHEQADVASRYGWSRSDERGGLVIVSRPH